MDDLRDTVYAEDLAHHVLGQRPGLAGMDMDGDDIDGLQAANPQ